MARAKYFISFIGPHYNQAPDAWTFFSGDEDFNVGINNGGVKLTRVLTRVERYVARLKERGVRSVPVWVRTAEVARQHSVCPVVWAKTAAPVHGPGYGAVKIGSVKIDELMDTITAHARMM